MKLKRKFNERGVTVAYKLDTHDGQFAQSKMPATVAEEIVQRADSLALSGEEGFEIVANGEMLFPKDIFDFDEGEVEGLSPVKAGRPTEAKRQKAGKRGDKE